MLIEPPPPGRAVNRLLSNKVFWIAAAAVFVLQGLRAMHAHQPDNFPDLKFTFDLNKVLSEEPWRYLINEVKRSTLYFSLVGIMFLHPVARGLQPVGDLCRRADHPDVDPHDRRRPAASRVGRPAPGACAVFLMGSLWIGRRHWAMVIGQAIGLSRPASGQPNYATRACAAGRCDARHGRLADRGRRDSLGGGDDRHVRPCGPRHSLHASSQTRSPFMRVMAMHDERGVELFALAVRSVATCSSPGFRATSDRLAAVEFAGQLAARAADRLARRRLTMRTPPAWWRRWRGR